MNCSFAAFLERYKHFELIPGELYFTITEETVKSANSEVPVSILDYPKDFATDKTPPSIKQIHAFYAIVSRFIASGNTVHFYTSMANLPCSLVYICTFLMTRKKQSADLTFAPFSLLSALIKPFHDISGKELFYDLTVVSVLRSFEKAVVNKWFSMETFNSDQYEYFNQIHMNWIIPDVLLAFSTTTPVPQNKAFLAFNKLHINHFISLGGLVYEQSNFFNYGFDYTEMRLKGITPSIDELKEFLEVTSNDHTFVIHSNGQIDLSGLMCACFLVRKYRFSPDEAIAWVRMCLPGAIVGKQQLFVADFEKQLSSTSLSHTAKNSISPPQSNSSHQGENDVSNNQSKKSSLSIKAPEPSNVPHRSAPRSRIRSALGPANAGPMVQIKQPNSMSVRMFDQASPLAPPIPPRPICPAVPACKTPRAPPPRKIPHLVATTQAA